MSKYESSINKGRYLVFDWITKNCSYFNTLTEAKAYYYSELNYAKEKSIDFDRSLYKIIDEVNSID